MDETTNPRTPTPNPAPQAANRAPMSAPSDSGAGPIVGAIIIVAVLVLGGLYYWGAYLEERDRASMTAEEILAAPDALLDELKAAEARAASKPRTRKK